MIVLDHEQGTEEWLEARRGKPTASNFDKIVTSDGSPSKQRTKYMYQLAVEIVSGQLSETFSNEHTDRGTALEPEARGFYEAMKDVDVKEVGFCHIDEPIEGIYYGASPDGLVGDDGQVQIKCPSAAVHIEYLLAGKLPTKYTQQVQGELLVTGRRWCDFVSYYPCVKPLIVRVERDEALHQKMRFELDVFCRDLAAFEKRLRV